MRRYVLGLIVAVGLIVLVIYLLLSGGSSTTSGFAGSLESYATSPGATATMTITGPVVAGQNHYSVVVAISQSTASVTEYQGYDGTVVTTQNIANTENGFATFLHALAHSGFTEGSNVPSLSDSRGYCPTGDQYQFAFSNNGTTLEQYWTSSCGSPKTFKGPLSLNIGLFENQIPNFNSIISNSNLNTTNSSIL